MLKKEKPTQNKKGQYLRKDSSFNIRDLVMRTPASTSPARSPDLYGEEKQAKSIKQDMVSRPSQADLLTAGNDKLEDLIQELSSFDVSTIQRRSDPRMKALTERINNTLAEIFGRNTEEYDDNVIWSLDTLPITIGGSWYPLPEVREGYHKGIRSAVTKLGSLLNVQERKLEAMTAQKPVRPATQEQAVGPVIAAKEKISLVNLRGKIKSRETILFSNTHPANGNAPGPQPPISESYLPEDNPKRVQQRNSFDPPLTREKGISDVKGDQRSVKEILRDRKNVVLLENLEEKLRKLQEEMPAIVEEVPESILSENQEPWTRSVQQDQDSKLFGKPDGKEVSLATLMAKLNEVVLNEPEYAEEHTPIPGNHEKTISLGEDEDYGRALSDGEVISESFVETVGFDSSGLDIEDEVLVIDGDNILSSESDFMETLEGDNGPQRAVECVLEDERVGDIAHGKERISLEILEQRLREFEEKEDAGEELLTGFERTKSEEILLIEGTDELPEEMMNELAQETECAEPCEAMFGNEEVLVIDGDEELPHESVSLESVVENPQEEDVLIIDGNASMNVNVGEGLSGDLLDDRAKELVTLETLETELKFLVPVDPHQQAFSVQDDKQLDRQIVQEIAQGSIINEEVLVIECDSELPEGVTDALPSEENLCACQEEESYRLETSLGAQSSFDAVPDQFDTVKTLIIDLFSQATPFGVVSHDRDERTRKAVLLEDLEERLRDFDSLSPDQGYLSLMDFYGFGDMEVHSKRREADEQTEEEHLVDLTDSDHRQPAGQPMVAFFGHDFLTGTSVHERIIEPTVYVTIAHESVAPKFMETAHTQEETNSVYDVIEAPSDGFDPESQAGEAIINVAPLELSEATVYGEDLIMESEKEFLPVDWDDLWYQEATDELVENVLSMEPTEEALDRHLTMENAYEKLPDQIFPKDVASSSDHDYETGIASPVDAFDFEPTLIEAAEEKNLEFDTVDSAQFDSSVLPDAEDEDHGGFKTFGEVVPVETVFVVGGEEPTNGAAMELGRENEITLMELPERITDAFERNLTDEELKTISESAEVPHETTESLLDSGALLEVNGPQESALLQPEIDQANTEARLEGLDHEEAFSQSVTDLATEPVMVANSIEIIEHHEMAEPASGKDREFGLLEIDGLFTADHQDTLTHGAALEPSGECVSLDLLENNHGEEEPLSTEAFEKCLVDSEGDMEAESGIDESSRDSILLEALEEMLSKLETDAPEESHAQPEVSFIQSTPPPKDEKALVIESHKEPPKKAILIKCKEERSNPFAVTEIGKERPHAKVLRADDLQAQIGELRYRIDDLKTFDIDSVEQRFDPRVRALGDTVNNTLADIFGRNTSAYWQHALPSLDSLPVVVGGPKFSQEELRDAYRRRINDAISKINITIDILEAKLSKCDDKGVLRVQPEVSFIQSTPPPQDEKALVIESHKEPPKKAILIKCKEERSNPFAVTEIGKERPHAKVLRADDLQAQIGELRYRIDDLKTFDIDSVEQRFDPRVRALGDTVNNTLADIFGRNTSAYWQHALPSLDSLPVVVGGPKFSQEELRDAYRRRINDAISKINITIDILEAKLSKCDDKGGGGQVLFFAPKASGYPDIQSIR